MQCNGVCIICPNPCVRGEVKGKEEKIPPLSLEEEKGASEAFDSIEVSSDVIISQTEDISSSKTGLSVIEDAGTYVIKKNIFGREKTVKVK